MSLAPHHRQTALAGILIVFLVAVVAVPAMAAPEGPATDPRIPSLIRQLGDPQFAIRQQATRELQAIGPASKEPLTQALQNPDAEVRLRAQRILVNVLEADFTARLEA
ncbi:MAG: hypothetical protein K8T91_27985, partial [Planctomycetes bacterium]|nr:hypothetical protein [Planctomycetota bacterium]